MFIFCFAQVGIGFDQLVDLLFGCLQDLCVLVLRLLFLFALSYDFQLSNGAFKLDHVLVSLHVAFLRVVKLLLQFLVLRFLHTKVLLKRGYLPWEVCLVRDRFESLALLILDAIHSSDF